jgi:fibronectin-binding autotransporter adhesin
MESRSALCKAGFPLLFLLASAITHAQDSFVLGPVERVSVERLTITVLGQTYGLTPNEVYVLGARKLPANRVASAITLGAYVAIEGVESPGGELFVKTILISKRPYVQGASDVFLGGTVAEYDAATGYVRVGSLKVNAAAVVAVNSVVDIQAGSRVEFIGRQAQAGSEVLPSQIHISPKLSAQSISGTGVQSISGTGIQSISGTGVQSISGTGIQSISGTGIQSISGTGVQSISGTGIQSISGTGVQSISGTGIQSISGTGVQSISGTGIQSISGTGVQSISGTGIQSISGTGVQSISGTGVQSISGTGIQSISGTGAQSISGTGVQSISGTGIQSISGTGIQSISGTGVQSISGTGMQNAARSTK